MHGLGKGGQGGTAVTVFCAMTLIEGMAEAQSFVLSEPLSFWGGLDAATGRIIDQWHPQSGRVISGHILVMQAGRGSSSGSSVLAEAIRLRTAPMGIVLLKRDAIVVTGAMVADALYGLSCPVVLAREEDWSKIAGASRLRIEARLQDASITSV
jgi:predicted aconitase with swiveling domain